NTAALTAGKYTVTYAYVPGDTDFTAQNATSTLFVGAKPKITLQPKSQTVNAGSSVTFTSTATGVPTPTIQCQISTNAGKTCSDISGATSTSLTLTTDYTMNGYKYRAVFTNSLATTTSTAATLTVDYAPIITLNPTNVTVTAGQTATFKASDKANPAAT